MSVFRVFLVRIIPHSDWTRRQTERERVRQYLSVFSPNSGKYGPEKLRMRTLFKQWTSPNIFTLNTFTFEQIIELIYWWCNYVMIQVSLTRLSFERCFARWWEKHPSNLRLIKSTCSWWVNFFFMNTEQISENIFT